MHENDAESDDTPAPRAYHHGDLRNALIEAGLKALSQQGAADLSLRALARELGVSANAVYRHFANKEALLSALAAEGFRRFADCQQAARHDPVAPGIGTGLAYVKFAREHPALFRLMFGSFVHADHDPGLLHASTQAFEGLLQDSRVRGQAAADEATVLRALARWSLVHGLSHLMLDGQLAWFGPEPEHLIRAVLQASGLGSQASVAAPAAPDQAAGAPSTNASS